MSASKPKYLLLTAAVIATLPVAFCASAQTAKPATPSSAAPIAKADADAPEKIIVTARRVNEALQDVPLSITALTGRDLAERGITNISELSLYTPGLIYSPDFGRTSERPVIRGISALRPEATQPVSVFIDGVFVRDAALGLAIDDAQRVEIIKGPQSALYGRSTYAGAINYITNKPGNNMNGKVSLTAAQAGETTLSAALTLPIATDMLSLRARYRTYKFDGQYTNSQTGNKLGKEKTDGGGLVLSFTPTKNFDALLTFDSSKDRDGIFPGVARPVPTQVAGVITSQNGSTNAANGTVCNGRTINIVGNNAAGIPDPAVPPTAVNRLNGWPCGAATFTGTTVRRNENDLANYTDPATGTSYGNIAGLDRKIDRSSLTMNYNFDGGMTLTGQFAQTKQKSNIAADESFNGTQFAITGVSWTSYNRDVLDYKSEELRLSSAQDQSLTWLLGVFSYQEDTSGVTSGVIQRIAGVISPAPLRPKSAGKVTNEAQFGRIQYEFSKQLRVSVEGRYSKETVKTGGTALGTAIVSAGACVAGQVCVINGERTFSDFSPRVTVDYKLAPDVMLYAQSAKGSKPGGFNTASGLAAEFFQFDGEKIQSFEVGAKTQLTNELMLNVALFRNDINNLQLSNAVPITNPFTGLVTSTTIVNNVGKARTGGFEAELNYRPLRWLTLSGNYAYTDAKSTEGTETVNGTVFGGNRSVAGFTLPRAPKHSFSTSIAIDLPISGTGLRGFGRVDANYQSRRYAEPQNLIWADPFTRINVTAGVRSKEWRLTAFVKNAANDNTSLNGFRYFDPVTFRRTAVDFLPRLRQYGLTLAYDFK